MPLPPLREPPADHPTNGMRVDEFDYHLPQELIAQHPAPERRASRLLAVDRVSGAMDHRAFPDILEYLRPNDCLVLNDTRVMPARLLGTKEGGGARIEILLLAQRDAVRFEALANRARRLSEGTRVRLGDDLVAVVDAVLDGGRFVFRFETSGDLSRALHRHGTLPLPPYIDRPPTDADTERYQTVYARKMGSAAAPTAGLHFDDDLLRATRQGGVALAYVTLHIGLDTFKPMKVERVEDHKMHTERYEVSPEAAERVRAARKSGGRVIAVGTTAVRVLESATDDAGNLAVGANATDCFIHPGYRFRQVDALVTNFHLPRSTLLLLVSAFVGVDLLREAYQEAIERRYRFYSYGDAMFLY